MFGIRRTGVLLAGCLALLVFGPEVIAQPRSDSIVFIECTGTGGKTSSGSGVIVNDRGLVLTAKHVAPDGSKCKGVRGTAATTPIRKLIRRKASANFDAVLLQFVRDPGEVFHAVGHIKITESMRKKQITAMGFPLDGTGEIFSPGGVISTTIPDDRGFIRTDALTTRQMSGGPVFLDENDGLVGLIVGADFDPGTGQPTNFSVLAAELIAAELGLSELDGGAARSTAVAECDRLASSPYDVTRSEGEMGIALDKIVPSIAIPACLNAIQLDPNNPRLWFNLGRANEAAKNQNDEAVDWYRKAADQGHASAQFNLGVMYASGEGIAKDEKKAVYWYHKAADQGYASAQFNLGNMYGNGRGIAKDEKQAVNWYRKAADRGDADAQFNLGIMYAKGQGIAKDEEQAVYWYRKAADQGDASAQFNLGNMYSDGKGIAKDEEQAVYWYRKAANQGYASAQFNLGNMYSEGRGVAKDKEQAFYWYRMAADQGHVQAQANNGSTHEFGKDFAKNGINNRTLSDIKKNYIIYYQFYDLDPENSLGLRNNLIARGWDVRGTGLTPTKAAKGQNEIRFGDPAVRHAAELLAADLRAIGRVLVKSVVKNPKIAKNVIEIWISD